MTQQKLIRFFILSLLTAFVFNMLMCMAGCRSIKHLTKTIDQSFAKKDSMSKANTVNVTTDSSKYDTEITIEYDSAAFGKKLMDGADADWDPFVPDDIPYQEAGHLTVVGFDHTPIVHTSQPVRRITIRTKTDLHIKDSGVTNTDTKIHTVQQEQKKSIVKEKKTSFAWWFLLLLIPVGYYLYKRYGSVLKTIWKTVV